MEDWEDILLKLPAGKIYDEFNSLHDTGYCNTYFVEVLNKERNYSGITELCNNIGGVMKTLSERSSDKDYITERCRFLNFWLHDKISKNFTKHMSETFNKDIIWNFFVGWNKINSQLLNNNCRVIYEHDIRLEEFNAFKYFYDYIKNYEQVDKKNFTDKRECNKYYSYVSYINDIYLRKKIKCCDRIDSSCRRFFFNCNKNYLPQNLMDKFKCDTLEKSDRVTDASEADTLADETETDQSPSRSRDTNDLNSDTPATPVSKAAMSVAFPMIGIFFIYSLIHKFTPFGSWLHNKVLGKKLKLTNGLQDEYDQDFLGNEPITTDVNSQKDLYNIAYYQA